MPEAVSPRKGEEIDIARLGDYLRTRISTPFEALEVSQFPAGSSNLTYLVKVGSSEYVLRRPPIGNTVATAHDMDREYNVLQRLSIVYPLAPEPFLFCEDTDVIGSEFYLMERREGRIIRGEVTESVSGSKDVQARLVSSFIGALAELHSVDFGFAGLGSIGNPEGYPKRQVEGWTKRYLAAKTHDHAELDEVIEWLNERVPKESGAAIVHNDYKFDNVMIDLADPTRITAVLDWEMVTLGDPLMDLGTTLGYWMSAAEGEEMLSMPFNPRVLMKNFSRRQLVEMYAEAVGRELPDMLYYYVFGTFKIAVIAQQIYSRFARGATQDPRFAKFDQFVSSLGRIAAEAIHKGHI